MLPDPLAPLLSGAHRLDAWRSSGVSKFEVVQDLGRRVHHGRWSFAGADAGDPLQRALADASVLPPDGALGGWGAAQVLGVAWVDGTTPDGRPLPSLLCLPPHRQVRRSGVVTLRSRLDPGDVVRIPGLDARVTSPVRTAFDLARTAPDLVAAVGHLDCFALHGVPAWEVADYAALRRRWSGVAQVRRAVGLASSRTRSPAESRFRMLWVLDARLASPLVNATVLDLDGGVHAEVDLLDPRTGLVGEYDGAHHSAAGRRSKDARRQERLESLGLTLVRCASTDLHDVRATVGRLRRAAQSAQTVSLSGPRLWSARELSVPRHALRPFSLVS